MFQEIEGGNYSDELFHLLFLEAAEGRDGASIIDIQRAIRGFDEACASERVEEWIASRGL
jgi:hypothetical protein